MSHADLMLEAAGLAEEAVRNRWGGPFGAVIAKNGVVIARGRNRVLLTGDVTAHAEIEAIRKALQVSNPYAPSIAEDHRNESTLELISKATGSTDPVPQRARMLSGMQIYSSAQPCPMCMGAIYWARLDACYFGCTVEETRQIGFDDAFIYEDLQRPLEDRQIEMKQLSHDVCSNAFKMWLDDSKRHYY